MTGKRASGGGEKVVKKRLADGTIKEYRYPKAAKPATRRLRQRNGRGIALLARDYVKSPEFLCLSVDWQHKKQRYLGTLEDELGWMTLADLGHRKARAKFYELRDRFADTAPTADKLLGTLSCLLSWAEERGRIDRNWAVKIGMLSEVAPRADKIWTEDDEAIAYGSFPKVLSLAMRFAIFTMARQGDLCRMRAEYYRDGWLSFQPRKTKDSTGIWVHLPVYLLTPLAALMEEIGAPTTDYLLTSTSGCPWQPASLRRRFAEAKARSSLAEADLHWHDLRGTGISRLFDAGCSDAEVASVSGRPIGGGGTMRAYASRSRTLAENAFRKLDRWLTSRAEVIQFPGNRAGNHGNLA